MKTLHLEIVTPDGLIFSDDVKSVVLPEPFAPINPLIIPLFNEKETPFKIKEVSCKAS